MLIRVQEGRYNPGGDVDQPGALEPAGRELWSSMIEDLSAASLHAAEIKADPGTWYPFDEFKALLNDASQAPAAQVFSSVNAHQPSVHKPWIATIEVEEQNVALMVCRSVVDHVEQIRNDREVWIRVE